MGNGYTGLESGRSTAHASIYCPSCGAQLIADENTAVTVCPYCNNPTVVAGQFKTKKPQFVIPFQLDKDKAVKILSDFYRGKPLLPRAFKTQNHIEEIKGVYVPFWLYNGVMEADMTFSATRVHSSPAEKKSLRRPAPITLFGKVPLPSRVYRQMPPAKCRMTTWMRSSRSITPN